MTPVFSSFFTRSKTAGGERLASFPRSAYLSRASWRRSASSFRLIGSSIAEKNRTGDRKDHKKGFCLFLYILFDLLFGKESPVGYLRLLTKFCNNQLAPNSILAIGYLLETHSKPARGKFEQ